MAILKHRVSLFWALALCSVALALSTFESAGMALSKRSRKQPPGKTGWVAVSNDRDTTTIIGKCFYTLVLCSWNSIAMNIPSEKDPWYKVLMIKCGLTGLAILGPELLVGLSINEFLSARESVKDFQSLRNTEAKHWTLVHAFYANAGGFVLCTNDAEPIPLDAKQLLYLVQHDIVELPQISSRQLQDFNKRDWFLRLLGAAQIAYFIASTIARWVKHVHVTKLELSGFAFTLCSVPAILFWWYKPMDVRTRYMLQSNYTLQEIKDSARLYPHTHARLDHVRYTELDFLSYPEWHFSKCWCHWMHVLHRLRVGYKIHTPGTMDRISNSKMRPIHGFEYFAMVAISCSYASFFIAFWNTEFPTPIERTLWRFASLGVLCAFLTYVFAIALGFFIWPVAREHLQGFSTYRRYRARLDFRRPEEDGIRRKIYDTIHFVAMKTRNNTMNGDPEMDVPIKSQIFLYPAAVTYLLGRATIVALDVIELRSVPVSTYTDGSLIGLIGL